MIAYYENEGLNIINSRTGRKKCVIEDVKKSAAIFKFSPNGLLIASINTNHIDIYYT